MRLELSTVFKRLIALALLGAVCVTAYAFVAQPLWVRYEQYRQSSAQLEALLVRYRHVGGSAQALQAELDELRSHPVSQSGYLSGASGALAAAELQNHVKAIVKSAGGELKSTQILPIGDEGDFVRIAIRIQMPVRMDPLHKILHALESGQPFVFIDNVDIRRRKTRRRRRPEGDVGLDVRLDVYGYMRAGAA